VKSLAIVGAAMLTPFGDLEATVNAIASGQRAGERDAAMGVSLARVSATASHARTARTVGPLPALALDVARSAAGDRRFDARTGVFVAVGGLRAQWDELAPAMADQRADRTNAWALGLGRMHPLWMLRYLSNSAHALVAAELGATGDGATFAGVAAAASALVAARAAIDDETIDRAIVIALDDQTADEVAVELATRKPGVIAGSGIAAIIVTTGEGALRISAADGVAPEAEPSPEAVASVRKRLPTGERELTFSAATGWLGTAGPLVDAIVAAHYLRVGWPERLDIGNPRSVTIASTGSPGQIGIVRVEGATG
jgi:hypothetical protein